MIRKGISTEIWWFIGVVLSATFVGMMLGFPAVAIIVGLLAFIARILYRLYRLEVWVVDARRGKPEAHELPGIWGEIAEDVILLHKRMDKDKGRLQSVVERVQDMTSALTDGIVLVDGQGNIGWWNSAAEKLLDFKEQDLGQKLTNLMRVPRFIDYFESDTYEEPLVLSTSRREQMHLQFEIHPFGQGERLIVTRDISRVYRLEQMRKDFVANVSHEMRTPLTVVRGYLETLSDMSEVPPVWVRAIEQMQQQVQRMTALVNDLITLTKLETDDRDTPKETVNIATLVKTIINDAKALSGDQGHQFFLEGEEDIELLGSERELRSAFSNLVFNAVNYSPNGAEIHVDYGISENEFVLTVSDTGLGIDPKHIPRLTERFYRVDSGRSHATGGTGLGLAIVKHVLLRHDAEIKITSKLGVGSQFSCHFPFYRLVPKGQAKVVGG